MHCRFFALRDGLSEAELERIVTLDFVRDIMLVLTTVADDDEIVIGSGSYRAFKEADGVLAAEVAFIVEEAEIAAIRRLERKEPETRAAG